MVEEAEFEDGDAEALDGGHWEGIVVGAIVVFGEVKGVVVT